MSDSLIVTNSDRKNPSENKLNKTEPVINSTSPADSRAKGRRHLPHSVRCETGVELHCPWDIPKVGEIGEELLCLAQLVPVQSGGKKRARKGRGSKYSLWVVDLQARRVAAMLEQVDMASGQPKEMTKAMTKALNKARSKGWGVPRDNSVTKKVEGEKGVILCEGLGCVGITQDGGGLEYWGRGAQNSVWGRWGLTRLKDSNSESSAESLRGVREKGNKTPSLKNKNSKSKVNFKPRRKTKNYLPTELRGTSIKKYFTSRPTQEVGLKGGSKGQAGGGDWNAGRRGGGGQNTGAVENKFGVYSCVQMCAETR